MLYQNENLHGGNIYQDRIDLDFSVNINPFGVSEAVLEAVRNAADRICHYPDPECRRLVEAIAEFEKVSRSFILCGNGAAELIYSFCSALKKEQPEGRALLTAPAFAEYELGLKNAEYGIVRYPLRKDLEFVLDEGVISCIEQTRPAAVFLCNPNNPDGRAIPGDLMEQILRLSKQLSFRLFVDECFTDLSDGAVSVRNHLKEYPNLLILRAFTKNFGIAGLRLGYCLSADEHLLGRMSDTVQPWNVSVIAQEAGIAALEDLTLLQKAREMIPAERNWLSDRLKEAGLKVYPSEANYILFQGPEGLDRQLRAAGIAIRSCSNYPELGPGWYRTAVKLHEENERLVRQICKICAALKGAE